MLRRRAGLWLAGLAIGVGALHAWLIGHLGARLSPPTPVAVAPAEPAASVPEAVPPPTVAPPPSPPLPPPAPAVIPAPALKAPAKASTAPVAGGAASAGIAPESLPRRMAAAASAVAPRDGAPALPPVAAASEPDLGEENEVPAVTATAPSTAADPVPVYRTRIPPSQRVRYRLSRGQIVGRGEIDWRHDERHYQITLEGLLPLIGTLLTQTSRGVFDTAGLAPERHTDRRIRRKERVASFDRTQGRVGFSTGAPDQALQPGMQDRLSVMVQLAAIAAAGPQPPPPGQRVRVLVIGARGDLAEWVLRFEGVQGLKLPDGLVTAWHYVREADSPRDTRAEYWLDPAQGYLPARVRLSDGRGGDPLELLRQP